MKLSVIMPVYNEKATIEKIISRVLAVPVEKELVIVDDHSTDGTRDILKTFEGKPSIKISYHPYNLGKGAGIRTGIRECTGDIVIIQDADLEYSPEEYPKLIEPIVRGAADVVYGSRFYGTHRVFMVWHYLGNKFLTAFTNVLYNTMLTDMETCYKVFRAEVLKNLELKSNRFDIEPEITAKIFKNRKLRVYEMPITYDGRDYDEGKKITWLDALPAIWTLIKYRFTD
ncbi:glycosyltransferase family 2 protein [candidate division TA06 bacterium]|uniref:Glycosyltransferase family 2 protein n=1 Tax=candidate division TA06 bacterium TaxID=2250710 RepID=A0A933I8J5_UNCT6|nr:glycosyltransferase family 2 protein [candidate division TA06 bacterium]